MTTSPGRESAQPTLTLTCGDVFPGSEERDRTHLQVDQWSHPVTYFVGRNGSGKSRTAKAAAHALADHSLATDRLLSLMNLISYPWGPVADDAKGVPLSAPNAAASWSWWREHVGASRELYALREQPEVWLRVAAFIKRALCTVTGFVPS